MILKKQCYEIVEQGRGYEGACKIAEYGGRVCYHSTDKITEDSYKQFVNTLIEHKHGAPLEHATIYLYFEYTSPLVDENYMASMDRYINYKSNKYSKVYKECNDGYKTQVYVTTNLRVLVENDWMRDLEFISDFIEGKHERRITVHLTTNRQVLAEITRHRAMSFAAESTRYCNYYKDKFDRQLTYIIPCWMNVEEGEYKPFEKDWRNNSISAEDNAYLTHLLNTEIAYMKLVSNDYRPEQAAGILPNALKTEIMVTGFVSDWQHLLNLRTSIIAETGRPHPQMSDLCDPIYREFIERGYITEKK